MFPPHVSSLLYIDTTRHTPSAGLLEGSTSLMGQTVDQPITVQSMTTTREGSTTYESSYKTLQFSATSGYGVYIFPDDTLSMRDICCHKIGHGKSICIQRLCEIHHRGEKVIFPTGTIGVYKNKTIIFADTVTNKRQIQEEVLSQWAKPDHKESLETWKELFATANVLDVGQKLLLEGFMEAKGFRAMAKDYRSPPLLKSTLSTVCINTMNLEEDLDDEVGNHFQELMFVDPTPLIEKRKGNTDLSIYEGSRRRQIQRETTEDIIEAIDTLETDVMVGDARVYALTNKLDNKELFFSNEVRVVLSRLESLEATIGN
jgi:hypothetical protein